MNIVHNNETVRVENSDSCVVYEYTQPTNALDMAIVELSGRYPNTGWVWNTTCEAVVYVAQGEGAVRYKDKLVRLVAGDQLYIPRNEKYAFEGMMKLLFASTPKWSPGQARHT